MSFNFSRLVPRAKAGIPASRVVFCGGRTAVSIAGHGGFAEIVSFGNQRHSNGELFKADPLSAWAQLFRPMLHFADGQAYMPEFFDTVFYPFGYDSNCEFRNVKFKHRLTVTNRGFILEAWTVKPAAEVIGLGCNLTETTVCVQKKHRQWERFQSFGDYAIASCFDSYPVTRKKNTALTQCDSFGYHEPLRSSTYVAVKSSGSLEFRATETYFPKSYFSTSMDAGNYAAIVVAFGESQALACQNADQLADAPRAVAAAERRRFCESLNTHTRLESFDPVIDSLVAMLPEYTRSVNVKDIPGAVRAADSGYWVWGWDSMVHTDALMFAGAHCDVYNRLKYYKRTSHRRLGIFHAIGCNGRPLMAMAPVAQSLYCVMLYHYYLWSQNRVHLGEFYDFADRVIANALADEVAETGLCRGVALYPDWPEDLEQNGEDISSFNNSILYQALRAMGELAATLGKADAAAGFKLRAEKLRTGFQRYLFDPQAGFFYDSISSRDLTPRRHYPAYAIQQVSSFALELAAGLEVPIADFVRQNYLQGSNVLMFPRQSPIFYSDGNQLGMYMPVIERFCRSITAATGGAAPVLDFMRQNWRQLTIPEALNTEAINNNLTPDNPGRKQAFTINSWVAQLYNNFLNLEFSLDRLRCGAPLDAAKNWKLKHLQIGRSTLDISYLGSGGRVTSLTLDGQNIAGNFLLYSKLAPGAHVLTVNLEE